MLMYMYSFSNLGYYMRAAELAFFFSIGVFVFFTGHKVYWTRESIVLFQITVFFNHKIFFLSFKKDFSSTIEARTISNRYTIFHCWSITNCFCYVWSLRCRYLFVFFPHNGFGDASGAILIWMAIVRWLAFNDGWCSFPVPSKTHRLLILIEYIFTFV